MAEPPPLPTPERMIDGITWAGNFLVSMMNDWPEHSYQYAPGIVDPVNVNVFPKGGNSEADKRRGRAIAHMCWRLAADEALIVEFDSHDGFWMITNSGAFFNSMDYLYRPVSYTPSRARVDSDGKVRLILCQDDPGYHNWLDTQGFSHGNTTYRNMLGNQLTVLETRLVKRAELEAALPPDSHRVSAAERTAQMWARFNGIRRQRYNL
jgi:hypothetical protein